MSATRDKIKELVAYLLISEPTDDKEAIENYTDSMMLGIDPSKRIEWNELRENFFNENTDVEKGKLPKINITPHHLFEWFKKEINEYLK